MIRPLDSYNKTWLGVAAVAVVAALIGGLLLVKQLGIGYRQFTAEFLQAAALRQETSSPSQGYRSVR